jgi:Lactate dehydrogenase and related dehydrogenases
MKPRAYITRRLPQAAIDIVSAACETTLWDDEANPVPRETLLRAVADVDGILTLLTDRVDTELLAAAPRLKVVANMAVGYDNVDLPALTARGVLLTNTPDVLTETTADLVWALILAASRRVVEGHRLIAAGGWTTWSPMFMVGQDVHGATLGIVGADGSVPPWRDARLASVCRSCTTTGVHHPRWKRRSARSPARLFAMRRRWMTCSALRMWWWCWFR